MARWKEEHPNKDATAEGHIVKDIACGGAFTTCVMYRHLPEGQWDVEVSETLMACIRETVDDGSATLRENQQLVNFQSLQKHANPLADTAGSGHVLESPMVAEAHREPGRKLFGWGGRWQGRMPCPG